MRRPIEPKKPHCPTKPNPPLQKIVVNQCIDTIDVLNKTFTLDDFNKIITNAAINKNIDILNVKFKFESESGGDLYVDSNEIYLFSIEEIDNPRFDSEQKAYVKKLNQYETKLSSYKEDIKKYEEKLKTFKLLNEDYELYKNKQEIEKFKREIEKLKKKLNQKLSRTLDK